MLGMTTTSDPGTTGVKDIADALGGGINENSLMIIEGAANTGKSVMCQHITYGVLHSRDSAIAYYSSEDNAKTLLQKMEALALDIKQDLATDRIRIYGINPKNNNVKDSDKFLKLIIKHVSELPQRFRLVIIDSATEYMSRVSPTVKVDFLQACKELCDNERSIALALDTHIFEGKTLYRAYAMSDYYLQLKSNDTMLDTGQVDTRVIKILTVTKLGGAERHSGEGIKFEIKPGMSISILPFVKVRI
jgi:archaellum biogenesis ATPase FlaH